MDSPLEARSRDVVLAPDVLMRSFHDPACRSVLELWRDGLIRLIITKDLLSLYVKALRALGLTEGILRRWALWFTARDKCLFLRDASSEGAGYWGVLEDAARRGRACFLVSTRPKGPEGPPGQAGLQWTTPVDFLNECRPLER